VTITAPYLDSVETYGPTFGSPSGITAPFLDTLWGFAPSITEVDPPSLEVLVGSTVIEDSYSRTFQEQLADPGSFQFRVPRDTFAGIDFDDVVRFKVNGLVAFQGIVEQLDHVALSSGEEADQSVTVSGRGALALLEQAVVYPSRGVGVLPIEDVRSFSWPAPDFDDLAWPLAKKVNRQRDYATWRAPLPWIWPDTSGYWIAPNLSSVSANNAPTGAWLLRKTFTLDDDATMRFFGAGDNSLVLYIDGAEMSEGQSFTTGRYVELDLTAGEHLIACRGNNYPKATLPNPTGIIIAGYTVGDAGLLDELIVNTDATWKCLPYPTRMPGFTHGQVLRILLEEAGLDSTISLDFTDDLDSGGNPWSTFREITVQVGRTLLDVVREMADAYIDVAMAPGSFTLRAWNRGGRGDVRSTTLQQTTDPATSDFLSLRHVGKRTRANSTLIRYQGGHREVEDASSVSEHGTRGLYLELGAVQGAAEADETARVVMENRAQPAYSTEAVLAPHNAAATPYDGFLVGDTITCPNEDDTPEAMRVRQVTMTEDANGVITWPVSLRDLQLELEERHDAWLRRMADGAALGGARVSSPAGTPAPFSQQITQLRVAEFSYDNSELVASLSPRRPAETSGNMVEVYAELTTAGSTSTVVRVYKNGATLATLTLAAGETEAETPLTIVPIRANIDKLQCEIVTAGTGAEGLDVQVRAI
jgi:hypothetical protein